MPGLMSLGLAALRHKRKPQAGFGGGVLGTGSHPDINSWDQNYKPPVNPNALGNENQYPVSIPGTGSLYTPPAPAPSSVNITGNFGGPPTTVPKPDLPNGQPDVQSLGIHHPNIPNLTPDVAPPPADDAPGFDYTNFFRNDSFGNFFGNGQGLGQGMSISRGGGGSGDGEEPGYCPADDQWVDFTRQVKDVVPGYPMDCLQPDGTVIRVPVLGIHFALQPCVHLVGANGCIKTVSRRTPITTRDGRSVNAEDYQSELWATYPNNKVEWVTVTVVDAGVKRVGYIDLGGQVFAAGRRPNLRGFTHNNLKAPGMLRRMGSGFWDTLNRA